MTVRPTQLKLVTPDELLIVWSDAMQRQIRVRELRDRCPCASCREKRTQQSQSQTSTLLPIITQAEIDPIRIQGMKPVGTYAYSIQFSDGHDTGIYTYELLRSLGKQVNAT